VQAHAGLGWVFRTWSARHGRELLLAGLVGLPLGPVSHLLDGYPELSCRILAWALLGSLPGARLMELALLTAEARSRRPAGMAARRWQVLRLAVAACSGAVGLLWLLAIMALILLDWRIEHRTIPVVLALGAGLGLMLHFGSVARR
jgi:hypothetical protein